MVVLKGLMSAALQRLLLAVPTNDTSTSTLYQPIQFTRGVLRIFLMDILHYAIGHVHEGITHSTFRPRALEQVIGISINVLTGNSHTGSF